MQVISRRRLLDESACPAARLAAFLSSSVLEEAVVAAEAAEAVVEEAAGEARVLPREETAEPPPLAGAVSTDACDADNADVR